MEITSFSWRKRDLKRERESERLETERHFFNPPRLIYVKQKRSKNLRDPKKKAKARKK